MMQAETRGPESPFRVHVRVVSALLRREMSTRYGRSVGGYFWAVAEPCGMIFLMSFAFSALQRSPELGQSFIVFFASGFLSFNFYRNTSKQIATTPRNARSLLLYPNVNLWDAIVARLVLQTLTNCLAATIILGAAIWHSGEPVQIDFLRIAPALLAATLLALGAGTMNAVLFQMFPTWERIFNIISRPLFIISGVLYTPDSLPRWLQELQAYNPLAHVISAFREGIYPFYHAVLGDLTYPFVLALVLIFFGLLLLRRYDERLMDS